MRAGQLASVWPVALKPAADSNDARPVELGLKFTTDVDGELVAIRFYKQAKNVGPHTLTLWNGTGFAIYQCTTTSESASGWQQVDLPSGVHIKAGKPYTLSYHAAAGYFSTTVDVFKAGAVVNGHLTALAGTYAYSDAVVLPENTAAFQSYGIDVVFSTGLMILPEAPPPAYADTSRGMLLGTGAAGLVRYGFNQHAWDWNRAMYDAVGAKAMRIGAASYSRFTRDNAYPGPQWYGGSDFFNGLIQKTTDQACADGFGVILVVAGAYYGGPADARWGEFCTAVAQANVKNKEHVIIELMNEPDYSRITAAQYATVLQVGSAAIRAVDPGLRISGPTINASYTDGAQKFINQLMAVPGIEKCFDFGSFHPYYQKPERCAESDILGFINRVDAPAVAHGRTDIEYIADEVGWSNAEGYLTQWGLSGKENFGGSLGTTIIQNTEVAADYYSRWIPIARATKKLRMVTFYALMDERATDSDPAMLDVQGRFGVWDEKRRTIKPAGIICKDLLPHVHAAIGAQMYQRDGWLSGCRYVRLDLPNDAHELVVWSQVPPCDDVLQVNAPQGGTLSIGVAGAPTEASKVPLTQGMNYVPVQLAARSKILMCDRPCTFPEFM